jgi:DNA-binding SARP family transcriptional activator
MRKASWKSFACKSFSTKSWFAGQAQARPKLAALLWGDRSEVQARGSLRQALSLVRKALSHVDPRALIAHEDTISFAPTTLTTGASLFAELVEQSGAESLEQARGLPSPRT